MKISLEGEKLLKRNICSFIDNKIAFILIMLSLIVSGCATSRSVGASRIREADSTTVSGCKYLGDVHGSSGWGNLAASVGMENAKNEAWERASELGATHIVWNQISGGYSPYVSGKAYYCVGHTVESVLPINDIPPSKETQQANDKKQNWWKAPK